MSEWIRCCDRLPEIHQQVLLADVACRKSFEPFGCHKDVGVLEDYGNGPHWQTQGEMRACTLQGFTHWSPITEPAE